MPATRTVTTRGGLRLRMRIWPGEGPSVIALHGLDHAAEAWAPVARWLGGRVRIVAPDLRGHGGSEASPDGNYGLVALADDVEDVVAACAGGPLFIVGHSLGGNVAAELVGRTGDEWRGCLIIDAGPYMAPAARPSPDAFAGATGEPERRLAALTRSLPLADSSDVAAIAEATVAGTDPSALRWWTAGALEEAATRVRWSLLRRVCPVVLVRGSTSSVVTRRAAAAALDEGLVDEVVEAPRSTHAVPLDRPDVIAAALEELAATAPATTQRS